MNETIAFRPEGGRRQNVVVNYTLASLDERTTAPGAESAGAPVNRPWQP